MTFENNKDRHMKTKQKLKRKILIPLILTIAFLIAMSVYSIYYIQNKNNSDDISEHRNGINNVFNTLITSESKMLASHINYLLKDTTIMQIYKNRNREELFNYCIPGFNEIKNEHNITHFYFLDTTGICFIRVHDKQRYNDTINRFTFTKAKQTKKAVYGIELGTYGTFTLRYVSPMIVDNKIIGYIELGMEIEHITPILKEITGTDILFLIDKKFINQQKWEAGLETFEKQGNWNKHADYIIIDKTIKYDLDINTIIKAEKNQCITTHIDDVNYEIGAIPLFDAGDIKVGKIIILENISEISKTMNNILLLIVIISIIVGIILTLLFYKHISNIENNINIANERLIMSGKKIEQSERKLKEAEQIAHLGYWERDLVNNKLYWSDETYRIFDLKPQEFEATYEAFLENIHPDDRKKVDEAYTNSLKTKTPYEIEHRLLLKSGKRKCVIEKCRTEYDKAGIPIRSIGTVLDISKRKKTEKDLKDSEERLNKLINSVPDIICFKDGKGRWLIANDADLRLFQLEDVDYIGKTDSELASFSPFYHDAFLGCVDTDEIAWQQKSISRGIEVIPNPEGEDSVYDIIKIPIFNPDNTRNSLAVFGRDITMLKKIEQSLKESEAKLQKSNKTKDKFFSIISHDLRSPFNALLGFSDILLKNHKKYDDEKRELIIKSVNNSANSAFKLLENLLTWSRSQSGVIKYLPEELHLKILLFETMFDLQGQADKKNIKVLDDILENELIYVDKNMIATVLRNLISNAIKYTHTNGEVKISLEKDDHSVIISVTDTGVGISKEEQQKIFDISEKSSTKGTENETGTGLGLILCKEFVEKHNGKIWVESEKGKGSVFLFRIPNRIHY